MLQFVPAIHSLGSVKVNVKNFFSFSQTSSRLPSHSKVQQGSE